MTKWKPPATLKFCLPTIIISQILRSWYIMACINLFQFFCHPCLLAHLLCYSNLPSNFKAVFFLAIWIYFDKTPRVSVTFLFFPFCCFFWWISSSVMSSYVSSIFGATCSSSWYLKSAEKWVLSLNYSIYRQIIYMAVLQLNIFCCWCYFVFFYCFTKTCTKPGQNVYFRLKWPKPKSLWRHIS